MGIKKTLNDLILNRSGSYRFYKEFYEKNKDSPSNPSLEKKFEKLQKDFNDYKAKNDDYIESANYLFTTLFVDYEMNEPTALLNSMHSLCKQLLLLVDNICSKYDLEWWVTEGNLLGAVRHQNFVPWDDDIDITLMRKDYMKLYEVINDEIEKTGLGDIIRVHYRHRQIDGETINSFIQLSVIHPIDIKKKPVLARLDVFPFDYIIDYDEDTIVEDHYNAKLNYYRNIKNELDLNECVAKLYEELHLSMEPTDKIIPGVEGSFGKNNYANLIIVDTDKMFPLKKVKFGDIMVNVPNDPDYYLRKVFGDYLSIPKSVHRHSFIETYRYSQDVKDVFEVCNGRLREVNENFEK